MLFLPLAGRFVSKLGEKHRHSGQSFRRPRFGAGPHERQGDGGGQTVRLAILDSAVEVDWTDAEIATAGGEQFAGELVVGHVGGDGGAQPAVIGLRRIWPQIDRKLRLDAQHIAPAQRPQVGKFVAFQQPVDENSALVRGVGIQDEIAGFLRAGQGADHVQIDAANEYRIGAQQRLNPQWHQVGRHQAVNRHHRGWRERILEDTRRRLGSGICLGRSVEGRHGGKQGDQASDIHA